MATPGYWKVPFLRVDFYATSTDGTALQFITSLDGEDASEDLALGADGTGTEDDDVISPTRRKSVQPTS